MKLLESIFASQVFLRRHYAKGKPHIKKGPYVTWRVAEAIEDLQEVLSTPYEQVTPKNPTKRTSESNPTYHTVADVGKFYSMPEAAKNQYFQLGGFPKAFNQQMATFNENTIMIRKPALEIIDYMKKADYNKLPVKYVIYGAAGCGKRITMAHVMHYAAVNNFVLLHLPAASVLHTSTQDDATNSETREGLVDLPLEGAVLLKQFQLQNEPLINQLELKTTEQYVWNLREETPVGSSLMMLVNHGINRVKYSCDALHALIGELKKAATNGRIRLLVAVGGINSFHDGRTKIGVNSKYDTTTQQISIYHSFRSLLEPNWCNGAFITTICEETTLPSHRGSFMPFSLLRREGFEDLDPFIPIHVPELSELEFHNLLDYYEDRRWLQKPGGREEIEFVTSRKAAEIRTYCDPL